MSEPPEDSGQHPQPSLAGGGEDHDKQHSESDDSRGLPAYHFDPLTQSRPASPAEHGRPDDTANANSTSDFPITTRRPSTIPGLDILAGAAAIVSNPNESESEPETTPTKTFTKTPNKGKQPMTPGVEPGSVASVWSGLYRTPGERDAVLVGVHETPGPITKTLSRANTPALPDGEGPFGKQRSSSLPPQLLPSRRESLRYYTSAAPADEAQPGNHTRSSGLAAGRLLAFLNPGMVAGAQAGGATSAASNVDHGKGGNNTAVPGPSRLSNGAADTAAGSNDTAMAKPSGTTSQAVNDRPVTPTRPTTPLAPTPSPLTPLTVSTVIISPKGIPDANAFAAKDPNGTHPRRSQTYQSFKADDKFLENNIHPIDEALIAPPIHNTYVIKTVSTIKCDECNTKLSNGGGELYQCKTCSAQICRDCVNERLQQEADHKAFGIKVRQDKAFAVGGYWMAVEPEPKRKVGSEGDKFEWQGGRKHLPFKRCYLDRRQFVGEDQGPFETDCVVPDREGDLYRIGVRIVRDTPKKRGGGGDSAPVGPGKGKSIVGKGRKASEEVKPGYDDVVDVDAARQRKRKANLKAKAKAKGKGKEPQGTEDEPIDLDEWDEESAQAQVQSAVLGGRPALDKLRRMQDAARLGRTMPPQPRGEVPTTPPAPRRGVTSTHVPQPMAYAGQQQEGVSGIAPQYSPGLYTGFGNANADKGRQRQDELDRQYLARQAQQQQQWRQGYGRPFDHPQQSEDQGSTLHGHPNPGGFRNRALQGQFAGGQGFPQQQQQQRHAPPATPHGGYLPHVGYPTPGAGLTQPSFMQLNPLYHPNPIMPVEDTANHYLTPPPKTRHHVQGNEVITQGPAPGWIPYIPLPSIFPDPAIHPGVYLGEARDIPFGCGNTFIEQDPFIDGTPLSLELPQPYFDNALAGLAEIQHHNNMIGIAIRRSKRRQQREEAGLDPGAPMTEAERREEEAEVARAEAEVDAQRFERGLHNRWYAYQRAQRSRRLDGTSSAQMNDIAAAELQGQQAALQAQLRQQPQTVNISRPGGFWDQVAKYRQRSGGSRPQANSAQAGVSSHQANNPQAGMSSRSVNDSQAGMSGHPINSPQIGISSEPLNHPQSGMSSQPVNDPRAGVRVRPGNPSSYIDSTGTQADTRGQPVNSLQAQIRGQEIYGSRYNTLPPAVTPTGRGRPTQEPVTINLIDSDEDEDTDTYVPRNVVRRARKRPRTSSATKTPAQPTRRINFASAQTQQLFNSNPTSNSTPAKQPPVSTDSQRSRPSREPRNVVRRARGRTQNPAPTSAPAQPVPQYATVFPHTTVWPRVYRGPMPSHPFTEPRNIVRRARAQFEAPGMRYQGALRYITGEVDAVDSTVGLPTRFVFVGVDYPFWASPTVGQPKLLPPVHFGPHASRIEMADTELSTRNRDTVIFNGFDSPVPPSSSPVREEARRLNVLVAAAAGVGDDDDETESEGVGERIEDVEMAVGSEDAVAPVKASRLRSGKEFQ